MTDKGRFRLLTKSFVGVWDRFPMVVIPCAVLDCHNHMLDDEPRLYFMHFWVNNDAVQLAEGLKAASAEINIAKR